MQTVKHNTKGYTATLLGASPVQLGIVFIKRTDTGKVIAVSADQLTVI
jgi:hypothetical protein